MISYCLMKKKQKKRSIYQLGNVAVVVSGSISGSVMSDSLRPLD